ncbi:MAG: hypothetical protein U1F20_04355 [Lysobacterales bacterium]
MICPFNLAAVPADGGAVIGMNVTLYSIDGVSRPATCTTVIGSLNRYIAPVYASKTTSVPVDPAGPWRAGTPPISAARPAPGSRAAHGRRSPATCRPRPPIGLLYALYNPNLTP